MAVYQLPCYSSIEGCWIEKVCARNFKDAEQKFIRAFIDDYQDIDVPSDWEDLINILKEQQDIVIGDIYNVEEFL